MEGCLSNVKMKNKYKRKLIEYPSGLLDDTARVFGVDRDFAGILLERKIADSASASTLANDFFDPLEMKDMDKAAEKLKEIISNGGKVLICGDYDSDGLTASAILKLFLNDNGVYADILIPTREEGYGLHIDTILNKFSAIKYNLIVTVDCGISEVNAIKTITEKLGVDIVVTDHHEPPEILPDCICVNPKLGYPFAFLSGAGVAFKLVQAIAGFEVASNYADLASVGTVADMMPLESENRSLVKLGLERFNHRGLKKLAEISKCTGDMSTTALAMKICPKINSAGRIGNPYVALDVLLMRDRAESSAVFKLNECNILRQELLEDTVTQARKKLANMNLSNSKIIAIYDENWKHGILGIAANRFKEIYKKPVIMLTSDGDNLVGSARGIDEVNLFEAFQKSKSLLERFGGHRSSVGLSVKKENFNSLVEELEKHIEVSEVDYAVYYDLEYDEKYLREENYSKILLLEPTYPNDKLRFHFKSVCKLCGTFGGSYLKMTLDDGLELKGFGNFSAFLPALKCGAEVEGVCTLEYDSFAKKVVGTLVSLSICNSLRLDEIYAVNLVERIKFEQQKRVYVDKLLLKSLLKSQNIMLIFSDYLEYEKVAGLYDLSDFYVDIFRNSTAARKQIVISPDKDVQFYSKTIIFSDFNSPIGFYYGDNCLYVELKSSLPSYLETTTIDRKVCMDVFKALKKFPNYFDLRSLHDNAVLFDLSYVQFLLALKVFEELGLVVFDQNGKYKIVENIKVNLEESVVFGYFGGEKI